MTQANSQNTASLQSPQDSTPNRGLIPRNAHRWAIALGMVGLVAYAFYDVNRHQEKRAKQQKAAPALAIGEPPQVKDLVALQVDQEASAPGLGGRLASTNRTPSADDQQPSGSRAPVPAAVLAAAGAGGDPASQVATAPKALSEDQQRRLDEVAARAAAAEAEHRARVMNSPIARIDNRNDERTPMPNEAQLAAMQAARGGGAGGGLDQDQLHREAAAERDEILQAIAKTGPGARVSNAKRDTEWIREATHAEPIPVTFASKPASKIMLAQGTRIPAVTHEALNSDLPGQITARVTEDVRDSLEQRHVLVPKGSRLVGRYSADISPGQERVLLAFSRMLLPDGRNVDLAGSQGVDGQGQAGLGGDVNNHWFKMFGHALAIALIADKALPDGGVKQSSNLTSSSSTRTVAGEVIADVAKRVLDRNTNIPPTITAPMGQRIFITITRDVVLEPWKGRG